MDKKRINKTNIFKIVAAILGIVILVGVAMRESNRNKVEAPDVEPEVTTTITTPVTTLVSTSINTTTENTTTVNTSAIASETTTEITTEETTTEIVTDALVIEVVPETEAPKAEQTANAEEVIETEPIIEVQPVETEKQEEYLVYKESTHYIHKNTCRWNKDDAYKVDDVSGLEARLCSECKPECTGYTEYIEPVPEVPAISDYDYALLCKIVACEYGGMADVYERAKIVASVMNQSKCTGDSIETCLYRSCVPWGFCPWNDYFCGGTIYYGDMSDAVDYYFNNPGEFQYWDCDSWWGDGYYNHFYKA